MPWAASMRPMSLPTTCANTSSGSDACRSVAQRRLLVQPWALEEFASVGGRHLHFHGAAVAIDRQRNLDAGIAHRPDAAEQSGEVADLGAADRQHDVASAQVGL